ncbi:MAG: hypothetical protein C0592_11005 [Marinilabiliales bacterium]|nr:MAG: hypothetical protein C0592_11005 [Marinilabiliales bacterium]
MTGIFACERSRNCEVLDEYNLKYCYPDGFKKIKPAEPLFYDEMKNVAEYELQNLSSGHVYFRIRSQHIDDRNQVRNNEWDFDEYCNNYVENLKALNSSSEVQSLRKSTLGKWRRMDISYTIQSDTFSQFRSDIVLLCETDVLTFEYNYYEMSGTLLKGYQDFDIKLSIY